MFEVTGVYKTILNPDGTWNRISGTAMIQHLNTEEGVVRFLEEFGSKVKDVKVIELPYKKDVTKNFVE